MLLYFLATPLGLVKSENSQELREVLCDTENIKDIKKTEPLFYPYVSYEAKLRCDEINEMEMLSVNEVLENTEHQVRDQVKVPKVVE